MQQNKGEPLKEFRITKRWNPDKAEAVYLLEQKFRETEYRSNKQIKFDYFKPVSNELDEEKAKKNAEHYSLTLPKEEHDWFTEFEELRKEREELGL